MIGGRGNFQKENDSNTSETEIEKFWLQVKFKKGQNFFFWVNTDSEQE